MSGKKVSILIIGAGGRCTIYAKLVKLISDKAEIVGVAEPRDFFRNRIADEHNVPEQYRFADWREAAAIPKFADAVIIGTQDRMHVEPAEAFAELGYHILIEKPLAPDIEGCYRIVAAAERHHVMLEVCHVMRYAEYTGILRQIIQSGAIGEITSIQHLEPVGHWRYAHSYVRGNWNREDKSSNVLLAKSIHDLDWISFIMQKSCTAISSFGSLMFFKRENMPEGAAERCVDCKIAESCPYNAPNFYLKRLKEGHFDNYLESVTDTMTPESIMEAMRSGPYGRCVFACDNDVADHQIVNMEFDGGATASFSLVGCSQYRDRQTVIFGTHGQISCDGNKIVVYSYLRDCTSEINIEPDNGTVTKHHGGGDKGCLEAFVNAILNNDPTLILSDGEVSLESHLMVFAAEASRKYRKMINMAEWRFYQ